MTTLTLGLIGVGRIGQMHATNLLQVRERFAARGIDLRITLADVAVDFARQIGHELGVGVADSVSELLAAELDGLIIATGTATHPELIRAGLAAGVPVFCEKPVASDVVSALPLLREIEASGAVVQIGHQRRFDPGYQLARERFAAGELGWIHSLRAITGDMFPPSVEFLAGSGGLFRDCSVHDFDILRWITAQEIVEVYARGSNNGDPAIGAVGDVDTALAVVTLADGTVGTVSATRYNGAGHDVRLEIQGSKGSLMVGLDEHSALRSAEPGVAFPSGAAHRTFAERFQAAYVEELAAFVELVLGERENPCTAFDAVAASLVADAAQLSLSEGRPVAVPDLAAILAGEQEPLPALDLMPAR